MTLQVEGGAVTRLTNFFRWHRAGNRLMSMRLGALILVLLSFPS